MEMSIERITRMEKYLEESVSAAEQLRESLEQMDAVRDSMIDLFQYYGSEEWYADREGDLPENIRAGVLSEDLVYDAITDVREIAIHMLEQATDILKNRI